MKLIDESIKETQDVRFFLDEKDSLSGLDEIPISKFQKAIVFCDQNLQKTWWKKIESILNNKIQIDGLMFLEPSENTKSLSYYSVLVDFLGENKCSRDTLIIVIGGGTVLDAIAYLASTYMRGIPLMMIPTTLIGQADASTAGKTCINTSYSKNALGTLFLPKFVYNNVAILETNSSYELRQGFSEIFKYGLLGSQKLLMLLSEYSKDACKGKLLEILVETIKVRMTLRKKDPLSSNFGHTFGHALEKFSDYSVNHGDAISAGMVMAMHFSVEEGILSQKLVDKIINSMSELGLNTKISNDISPEKLTQIMLTDKKSSNTEIRLVLIEGIAKPFKSKNSNFYSVDPKRIQKFLEGFNGKSQFIEASHWESLR